MQHARQTLIKGWNQEAIDRVHASVVGCGALGSQVACSLARLGVGRVMLIDPDVIEEHNLENQVFDADDVGKPKVHALTERVRAIDASVAVGAFVGPVEGFRGELGDVVFSCLDNVSARHFVSATSVLANKVVIDGGIEGLRGGVMTITPGVTACHACYPLLPAAAPKASCSQDPIPSTYVTAAVVANVQVAQLIKLVHKQAVRAYVSVDLANGRAWSSDLEPNPECEICGGA